MSFVDRLESSNITACHFCKSHQFERLWSKNSFDYLKCQKCQMIFVNPQLKEESVDEIHRIVHPQKKKQDILRYNFKNYKISLLRRMKFYYQTGRLLDIGCGKGYFVASARGNGWESFGLDISQYNIIYAREILKQKVILTDLREAAFPDDYFDVVTLFDTLEHLRDPFPYLKEVYRILRRGGLLYIETPNFNSLSRRLWNKRWAVFSPCHFYYFTPATLKEKLEEVGFKIRYSITWGISPFGCKDAVNHLEKLSNLNFNLDNPNDNKKEELSKKNIGRLLLFVYNWVKFAERALFIAFERCNLSLGTKIELWADKPIG
jgi:SAM-dependent methyltransferase